MGLIQPFLYEDKHCPDCVLAESNVVVQSKKIAYHIGVQLKEDLMEESINYKDDDEKATTSTQWDVAATSALSIEEESSDLFHQRQNLKLHLFQKKEISSERRVIPSSIHERLSYYRTLTSSTTKAQIICTQHLQFNRFLWYYIVNAIFKNIPHTFVQIFLSSYAPEEHLFISKMVPFFLGTKGMFIIAGFFELIDFIDSTILLFDYVICGLLFQTPWNRCEIKSYTFGKMNKTIHCFNLTEFAKKFVNGTSKFETFWYVDANNESFQVSQIEYYRYRKQIWNSYISFIYFTIVWFSIGITHPVVFKKMFWKMLNTAQWILNFVDIAFLIHLSLAYFHEEFKDTKIIEIPSPDAFNTMWKVDIGMLAESTTAPPVVHVLTARSTQEINPSKDSAIIITSNAICFLFRVLLAYRVRKYVENLIGAPLYLTDLNEHSWFYFFPMYLSTFYLGCLYTLMFLGLNLMIEMMTVTVTYHSFIEIIVCEWHWATRCRTTIFFFVVGLIIYFLTTQNIRMYLYISSKIIAVLSEVMVLYCIYPLGRLLDDFTFHYGEPPTKLRIFSLRMVPIFYSIKCFAFMNGLMEFMMKSGFMHSIGVYKWMPLLMFVPVLFGMMYTVHKYTYKQKKSWQLMFRPDINWGPRDSPTRQLRKQFDSRVYIGSQAPRSLSRYLIGKAEPMAYRIDLHYDTNWHPNVANLINTRFENEKKHV